MAKGEIKEIIAINIERKFRLKSDDLFIYDSQFGKISIDDHTSRLEKLKERLGKPMIIEGKEIHIII
jgi:hypothetical protein